MCMNSISCMCPFRDAVQQVLQKQELEFTLCEPTMPYVYSGFQSRQDLHLFQTNRYYLFYDSRAKARMSALGQPCSLFIRIAEGQQELLSRISQEYNTKAPHARLHPSCVLPYFCEADIVKHLSFTVDPPARRETQLRLISCMSWYEAPIERAGSQMRHFAPSLRKTARLVRVGEGHLWCILRGPPRGSTQRALRGSYSPGDRAISVGQGRLLPRADAIACKATIYLESDARCWSELRVA